VTEPAPGPARSLVSQLVQSGGGAVAAVLLYGSQLLRSRPDRHSAYDFVVIVEDYGCFYRALRASGELPRPAWLMKAMAQVLPPNVIAFAPGEGRGEIGKCQIVSREHFQRALGTAPRDHFMLGRLVQQVETVWSAGPAEAAWVDEQLAGARGGVLTWMAPYLEGPFDAEQLGRRLLEVCYQGELRPEAKDRAETIFQAQVDHFREAFPEVLERGVAEGVLVREGVGAIGAGVLYRLASPAPPAQGRRWRRHFLRSKARATARWFKHMITFANWLPYIVRKVERHSGRAIELTPLERKLPIIFLWPRAIHVLLSRPAGTSARDPEAGREIEP